MTLSNIKYFIFTANKIYYCNINIKTSRKNQIVNNFNEKSRLASASTKRREISRLREIPGARRGMLRIAVEAKVKSI